MATKCIVNKSTMSGIADAIRAKGGTTDAMLPSEMAAKIAAIPSGGGDWWLDENWPDIREILSGTPKTSGFPYRVILLYSSGASFNLITGYNDKRFIVCDGRTFEYTGAVTTITFEDSWKAGHSFGWVIVESKNNPVNYGSNFAGLLWLHAEDGSVANCSAFNGSTIRVCTGGIYFQSNAFYNAAQLRYVERLEYEPKYYLFNITPCLVEVGFDSVTFASGGTETAYFNGFHGRALPNHIDCTKRANLSANTFSNCVNLSKLPSHLSINLSFSFAGSTAITDRDSVAEFGTDGELVTANSRGMLNNINTCAADGQTITLNSTIKGMFTTDEQAKIVEMVTAKNWGLVW